MTAFEWLILGIIFVAGAAACIAIERIKKQGHRQLPGSMCAGCPNTATVDRRSVDAKPKIHEHEHPDIML